jgi:hypothetical protein
MDPSIGRPESEGQKLAPFAPSHTTACRGHDTMAGGLPSGIADAVVTGVTRVSLFSIPTWVTVLVWISRSRSRAASPFSTLRSRP